MIELHYELKEGSIENALDSIISYLTPDTSTQEGMIANIMLRPVREGFQEEARVVRTAKIGIMTAATAGKALGIYPANDLTRQEIMELTDIRYTPLDARITDYFLSIYGSKAGGIGEYPLTIGIKGNNAGSFEGSREIRDFGKMAKEFGFEKATKMLYSMQDKGIYNRRFNPPINENILKQKLDEDSRETYDLKFYSEIQMIRFLWDFAGNALNIAGYAPARLKCETFTIDQPQLDKDLEKITAFPATPAYQAALEITQSKEVFEKKVVKALIIKKKSIMDIDLREIIDGL